MRSAKSGLRHSLVPPALTFTLLCYAPAALAGGGFSEPGFVQQTQTAATASYSAKGTAVAAESVTLTASGDGFGFTSTTGGTGGAAGRASSVAVWDATSVQTSVPANVSVDSNSMSFTFDKGGNSISFGKATTEATVVINGKTYAVAQELAVAFARSSQFGSSAAVEVDGTLTLPASGYSATSVASSKAGGR